MPTARREERAASAWDCPVALGTEIRPAAPARRGLREVPELSRAVAVHIPCWTGGRSCGPTGVCAIFGHRASHHPGAVLGTWHAPPWPAPVSNAGALRVAGLRRKRPPATVRSRVEAIGERTKPLVQPELSSSDVSADRSHVLERNPGSDCIAWLFATRWAIRPRSFRYWEPASTTRGLELVWSSVRKVVSFPFRHPDRRAVDALKSRLTLISTATCVAEARALEAAGMDAVSCPGWVRRAATRIACHDRFRGRRRHHGRSFRRSSRPFACQSSRPAAIGDGRGIASALALGASGPRSEPPSSPVPTPRGPGRGGSCFSQVHGPRPRFVDRRDFGRCARAVRSRYAEEMERTGNPCPPFCQIAGPEWTDPVAPPTMADESFFSSIGQGTAALAKEIAARHGSSRSLVEETQAALTRLGSR